jgi:DNA-binding transcriptional regulator YiaG
MGAATRRRNHGAEVAELLKAWREAANLPQSRAAQMLDVSVRTLQGWEAGRGMPYPKLLALALEAFK